MPRLSPNIKLRYPFFIPPMGRLDDEILNASVALENTNGEVINLTVSEYLQNQKGLTVGAALDGQHYSEVLGNFGEDNILRSLATKYIPASSSSSKAQPPFYIATDANKNVFHFVSFQDKTFTMTEQDITQAINTAIAGFTVMGRLRSISSLYSNRILTLEDNSEMIVKTNNYITYIRLETSDGTNVTRDSSSRFLWELVDRTVPDSDILTVLADNYNLGSKIDDIDVNLDTAIEETSRISDKISNLTYQLDSTRNIVNFLATKIAEQKDQIASVQSSISSSSSLLYNAIDHVDKEQGSNYIKLEDMSKSVQGINFALSQLSTLQSNVEASKNMDESMIRLLEDIKNELDQLNQKSHDVDLPKSDKTLTSITIINLLLQIIALATKTRS